MARYELLVWSNTGREWNHVQCFDTPMESENYVERMPSDLKYKTVLYQGIRKQYIPTVETVQDAPGSIDATVYVNGSVRIGNGQKLHRARKDSRYGIMIHCSCPGTGNGSANHKATFYAGVQANCGN